MIVSAMRRIAGRLSHSPSGTPTAIASPPEIATSFMCCCVRKMMSLRYLPIASIRPPRCATTPSANATMSEIAANHRPDMTERIAIGRLMGRAARGAIRFTEHAGDAGLRDESGECAFAIDTGKPADVVHEHHRDGRAKVILETHGRGQWRSMLADPARAVADDGEVDIAMRSTFGIDDRR